MIYTCAIWILSVLGSVHTIVHNHILHIQMYLWVYTLNYWFFFPNSRSLLPTFSTNCPEGSQFVYMGSHFAQNTTYNPYSVLSRHIPKVGKMKYHLGKLDPNWAKCWKVDKTFLEVCSGPRFMICVTLFCTLFCNVQKHVTESDISGHCLPRSGQFFFVHIHWVVHWVQCNM